MTLKKGRATMPESDNPKVTLTHPPLAEINWPLPPGSWSPNTDGWPLTGA